MITVNLTVFRETSGALHLPDGSLLPTVVTCEPVGTYTVLASLETVILKSVLGVLVEQSTWESGDIVATKIIDECTGDFAYVKETVNDVYGLQNPCCTMGVIRFGSFSDDFFTDFDT